MAPEQRENTSPMSTDKLLHQLRQVRADSHSTINFVGVHFDILQCTVHTQAEEMDRLMTWVATVTFLNNQVVPVQAWENLLGLLNQLEDYFP